MNPFDSFSGFCLSGKFYSRRAIVNSEFNTDNLLENEVEAIAFAAELFGDSPSITVETSGSTGSPKRIVFSKKAVITSAHATNRFFNLSSASIAVLPLPMRYIAGKMMVARAIAGGYNLMVRNPASNLDLRNIQADFMPVTPFQMHVLIDAQPEMLHNIGTYLIGGGEPNAALIAKVNKHRVAAFASFGMTETLSHFALANLTGVDDQPEYTPLKGVEIEINNEGKLLVYWPGLLSQTINTNDLVEYTSNGFRWLGRADNLINSGGVKIIPERVERVLQNFIHTPFFVGQIPHPTLGHELTLFVEDGIELDLDSISWSFKYQQPRTIVVISPFLRTVSGKIKREATVAHWLKSSD